MSTHNSTFQSFIDTAVERSAEVDAAYLKLEQAIGRLFDSPTLGPNILLGIFVGLVIGCFVFGLLGLIWFVIDLCMFGPEIIITRPDRRTMLLNSVKYQLESIYAKEEAEKAVNAIPTIETIAVQDRDEFGNPTRVVTKLDQKMNKSMVPYIFDQNPKPMSLPKQHLRISKLWACMRSPEQEHDPNVEYVYKRDPVYAYKIDESFKRVI